MLRPFLASLNKDRKLLFRSLTSVFLVIIGPLFLLLVLMAAFSDIGFNHITLGYIKTVQETKFDSFLPKLSYLGDFQEYDSLAACQKEVQRQSIYLCLEPTPLVLKVHFDNTRELISLILLNQIRVAATLEKEALQKRQAEGFLGEVEQADDFLGSAEKFSQIVLVDLAEQRKELVQAGRELQEFRSDVKETRLSLENVMREVQGQQDTVEQTVLGEIDSAVATAGVAGTALQQAEIAARNARDESSASRFSTYRVELEQSRLDLQNIRTTATTSFALADNSFQQVDDALREVKELEDFLQNREQDVQGMISTIDGRTKQLGDLQQQIRVQREKVGAVAGLEVNSLVHPLEVEFSPLFLASKRLQQLRFRPDLPLEEKQRLINFGTLQTFLPLLVLLVVSFITTILANILLLDEIHSPSFLRNTIIPSSWIIRFLSQFTLIAMVALGQALLIFGAGYVVFFLDMGWNVGPLFFILFLLMGIYSLCGMTIAYFVKTKTTSLLFSVFFLLLNLLLGGVLYPVERMASFMAGIANWIPFTLGISVIQQSLFYNVPFSSLVYPIGKLVILFLLAFAFFLLGRWVYMYRSGQGH